MRYPEEIKEILKTKHINENDFIELVKNYMSELDRHFFNKLNKEDQLDVCYLYTMLLGYMKKITKLLKLPEEIEIICQCRYFYIFNSYIERYKKHLYLRCENNDLIKWCLDSFSSEDIEEMINKSINIKKNCLFIKAIRTCKEVDINDTENNSDNQKKAKVLILKLLDTQRKLFYLLNPTYF